MFINEVGEKEYDIAIVGAGPAGMSLALRISEQSNAKILLVESGVLESNPEINQLSEVDATGDLPSSYYPVHAQRNFGGTSIIWNGYCTILEERAFLNGEWPIPYTDIISFYKDAVEILGLPEEAYLEPSQRFPTDAYNIIYKPYYTGSPVRFGEKYRTYFSEHPNIDVLLNHTCTEVHSNNKAIETLSLQTSTGNPDSSINIRAKYYVLACGGIGNARLMQLGNIAPQSPVGQYFMEHPHIYDEAVLELDKAVIDSIIGSGRVFHALQLSDEYCVQNNLLNFAVSFSTDDVEPRIFLGEKRDAYISDATIRSEMVPQAANRISLSENVDPLQQAKGQIDFYFNYQALAKKSWDAFAKELLASGIGRATSPPDVYQEISGGGHYVGSTRMGASADSSVVDGDCKVHETDNLYVAGSSIFPAASAANPTLSIVAFALRLADHLSERFRGEYSL